MASEIDICNTALSHLGDSSNVVSFTEGSAQAEHCARWYPVARDGLLEMHDWSFATRRVALAQLTNPSTTWDFCYAQPTDLVNSISVLAPDATDDTSVGYVIPPTWNGTPLTAGGVYTPQPYQLESLTDGTEIVLTNQEQAVLRYVARVTDPTKFSPLFVLTLGASLASLLAGPIIKGEAGISAAAKWGLIAFGQNGKSGLFGQAAASDAGQKRSTTRDRHQVAWLNGR